jgi:hypothetical protein
VWSSNFGDAGGEFFTDRRLVADVVADFEDGRVEVFERPIGWLAPLSGTSVVWAVSVMVNLSC